MQRVIYPLNVRYPAANHRRAANDNILLADALEYAEVSCRGGDRERLCMRVTVKIPWTPVLYLAVRENGAYRLRRELKLLLMSRRMGSVNARAWISVCGLTRAVDEFAWRRNERMRLYEFAFDNFAALATAKCYLRDNALARSGEYLLFAVDDNVAFNVALTASLRDSARRKRPREDENDESNSSSGGGGGGGATLDLSAAFELASWCRVDLTRADRLKRLSTAEIRANGLPEDPLATLPVVSYDIETIAANENTLPRGTEEDQKLASLALTVHEPNRGAEYAAYAFVYAPVASAERLERLETRAREIFAPERTDVMFFTDERLLLWSTLETLRNNEFLAPYYSLDNVADARSLACILVGYNAWEYDHPFFVARLAYHGLHEDALALGEFLAPSDGPREPRFCRSQISFDLMKHVIARYRAQVGSVALAHVSRYFGTEDDQRKLDFDSVAIRRLYYDTNRRREHFDEAAAFDDEATLCLHNAVRYNVRDCAAVYHLARNIDFLSTTAQYARHFYVSVTEASYVGNSRLLPNAFAARSLSASRTVLHWRDNATSHTTVRLLRSAASIHPSSPRAYGTNETLDVEKRDGAIFDEARLMRVADKSYIGGINSAESGRYAHITAVDFASFYPSIGCAYRLSMETVRVITVARLLDVFVDRAVLDEAMECGMLRAFDYEPEVSPHRRTRCARTGDPLLHGRDELARGTLSASADAWYEGVEFVDSEEMLRSSVDLTRRRVLTVYAPNDTPPVISSLWRYYLDRRREYKTKMCETRDPAARRVLGCQEKMFKVVANSLYGYLNYRRSAVYAPAVAAAITLLSRKTFHETTWVCVRMFPRYLAQKRGDATTMPQPSQPPVDLRVVYRDTDGIVVRANRALGADETELPRLVNEQFRAQGRADIALELEDANTHDCTIMGKKKYWKTLADGSFVTKGFERNAQPFVKALVHALQCNANEMAVSGSFSRRFHSYRLAVRDVENFFLCMYDSLHDYYLRHGSRDFEFNVALNPRENSGPEAIFIQSLLDRYDYDTGDRARCVFALDPHDCTATLFRLSRDFDPKSESINYYKIVRRLAIYFLQVVEGFKRNDTTIESRLRIGPRQFDETLRRAYSVWLADTNKMTRRLYSGFFRIDDEDENDSPRHDSVANEDVEVLPLID